jgi:hypothetical protein
MDVPQTYNIRLRNTSNQIIMVTHDSSLSNKPLKTRFDKVIIFPFDTANLSLSITPLVTNGKFLDSIPLKVLGPYKTEIVYLPIKGYIISKKSTQKKPEIIFENTFVNLGKISRGVEYQCRFYFKNIGDADLMIENITSKGKATYPTKPIKVGEEGIIMITITAQGDNENFREYIEVTTNAFEAENIQLVIKGKFSR